MKKIYFLNHIDKDIKTIHILLKINYEIKNSINFQNSKY